MSSVDNRIVEMDFKSAGFINGVNNVISALGRLREKLKFGDEARALDDLNSAGSRFNLGGMGAAADRVASHFNAMRIVAFTALANITNRAVDAGISLVKAFTVDPIKAGLDVYETKINAIQTILANTQAEGTNLKQVTDALNQLNVYANKTVYNFGQMAHNIGVFTAAGVDLKTSVASIKGIANLAALSGSSAEQASNGMYQLSQAIAAGVVKLQDWNSVVNAGFGGKVFQNALVETARAQGVQVDKMIAKYGSFRQSLQSGWLSSKILTDTLQTFTGDLSASQLRAMGYTEAETKAIQKQAAAAVQSATQIRTITQLQAALREEVATAWANVWEQLIGNINGASSTLTNIHNILENAFTKPVYDLANLLKGFNELGGRALVFQSIKNIFAGLKSVLQPIAQAFRDIFPPATAETLFHMALTLTTFTEKLKLSAKASEDIRRIFDGIFSAVKIVIDVFKGLFGALGQSASATGKAGGSLLDFIAKIADFITRIRKAIEAGNAFTDFFRILGNIISIPIKILTGAGNAIGAVGDKTKSAFGVIASFTSKIADEFSKIGQAIGNAIKNGDFSSVLTILNQVLFGGVLLAIRKFFTGLGKKELPGSGLFSSIKESFETLTGTLKTMQTNLKSDTLLKIAAAVGILTASVVALSLIDTGRLAKALSALGVMFTELLTGMLVVGKIAASGGILKMGGIAAALILLSTAILILSGAVAILAQFSWTQLAKGLGSIAVLLLELSVATAIMSGNSKGLITTAIALNAIAVALNLLAIAVGTLGKMDFGKLAKGIGSVAAILLVVAGFNAISGGGKALIATAASMVILGGALNVIALAVKQLGDIGTGQLVRGLLGIAGALGIIALAMLIMPKDLPLTAAGLLLVSVSLEILSKALARMGALSWGAVARALVLLAGSLVIIAAAMIAMTEALPGAAALIVVAGALAILAPILVILGKQSWGDIVKGLAALAGVFVVLGLAGLLLTPLIPALVGLGAAIAILGVGLLAAGGGLALFGVGLTAIAVSGSAAAGALAGIVNTLLGLIPTVLAKVGETVGAFADAITRAIPAVVKAIVAVLTALLDAIIKVIPKAAKAFEKILDALIQIVGRDAPKVLATVAKLLLEIVRTIASHATAFAAAGFTIIANLLKGIAQKVPSVVAEATNIVVAFITAVGRGALRVTQTGINVIISFINGLADQIRASQPRLNAAGANLASAIITGMASGLLGGSGIIATTAENIAKSALDAAKNFLGINSPSKKFMEVGQGAAEGFALGMTTHTGLVTDSMEKTSKAALIALSNSLEDIKRITDGKLKRYHPVIQASWNIKELEAELSKMTRVVLFPSQSQSSADTINRGFKRLVEPGAVVPTTQVITFNQSNTSPKALSAADIYRQTKNQLSIAKGALTQLCSRS
jgi:tape measure domain-containing protein